MTDHILLVGMMGAGKTTVGELLAADLDCPYRDSDADVAAATGLTVPEIFETQGEAAFRAAEADVLARACAEPGPTVISVAGGAVLSPANRDLLRTSGTVVWLRARPETLAARVGRGVGRPLLDDDPAAVLAALDQQRAALYAEVADLTIDVDELSPAEVTTAIRQKVAVA
jgi:shikimate kinase